MTRLRWLGGFGGQKPLALAILVGAVSAATATAGCGSSEDDDGNAVSGQSGGSGSTDTNGSGGTELDLNPDGGTTQQDGGSVDLTEDQVAQIEDSSCAGWSGEGEMLPAVLQLVVDVSGSMDDRAPGTRDSKWEVTHAALEEALEILGGDTAVGALLYPNVPRGDTGESSRPRPIDECVAVDELLPIDELGETSSTQRQALLTLMDRAEIGGGTPTHDAYQYALNEGLIPFETPLQKFMLLITDGQPTYSEDCVGDGMAIHAVDPQPIVDSVEAAYDDYGIRTFIIGSPGSESASETGEDMRAWLSEAAQLGGTAIDGCDVEGPNYCHLDMTEAPDFGVALREGLAQVIGQMGQCTYALPSPPAGESLDLDAINLLIHTTAGTTLVLPDNVGDCTEGWQFDEDDNVVLCSDTCDAVKGDSGARVELLFGCISGEIPELY